jgi:hypothetical protein
MKGDVFGTQGDFTTSPEISQMFGEVSLCPTWYLGSEGLLISAFVYLILSVDVRYMVCDSMASSWITFEYTVCGVGTWARYIDG